MTAPPPGELARFRAIFLKFYRISPHLHLHLYLYLYLLLLLYLLLYLLLLLPPAEVPAGREERRRSSRPAPRKTRPRPERRKPGTGRDPRLFRAADKKQLT